MYPNCLLLSDDLVDASRVVGDGKAAGLAVRHCRDLVRLLDAIPQGPALIVLDLHFPGLNLNEVLPLARTAGSKVVAFGPHVDANGLKAAREAGCDEVLPRSAFYKGLEEKLRQWASG